MISYRWRRVGPQQVDPHQIDTPQVDPPRVGPHPGSGHRFVAAVALSMAVLTLVSGCSRRLPPSPPAVSGAATPSPETVESVLFLVGDPGEAIPGRSPLMAQLAAEVEAWAGLLPESSIRVAYLGDLVYPVGVRPVGTPEHRQDTLALRAQLDVIGGEAASRQRVELLFIPGNHDWGNDIGAKGAERLGHTEAVIERWAGLGYPVRMTPSNAVIGPVVLPLGSDVQAVILDTQAWLAGTDAERAAAGIDLRQALSAPGQTSIILGHHPLRTGGNHGERALDDPFALLSRAGAIPQDLTSTPYRRMKTEIENAFAEAGRPLLFAAGHDHNLQLFGAGDPVREPRWTLISGSASKLTDVADAPGMVFGGPWPGFGRLFVLRDGRIILQVEAAGSGAQLCDQAAVSDITRCLSEQSGGFRTIFSERLRGAR